MLARIPHATYRLYGKSAARVRDVKGLWLTPHASLADAPPLDVLHVPGGFGEESLMDDTDSSREARAAITARREETARRVAAKLGMAPAAGAE